MGKPDPNVSDWSDLDLLTIDEATERLDVEIAAITAALGTLGDADRDTAQRRLDLLVKARDRAAAGPTRALYDYEPPSHPDHVPAALVRDVDHVFGADFLVDPFAAYRELRDQRVIWSPKHGGYWILTRAEDIRSALQQPELFSSRATGIPAHDSRREKLYPLELDPPEHTAYRKVIAPLFAPRAVTARTAAIDDTCAALIADVADRGRAEFVADFAEPFPTRIFTNILGLPIEEASRFVRWNNALLRNADRPDLRREAGAEINGYLRELIATRRLDPRDDVVSALVTAEVDDRPVTDEEVQNLCFLLFIAGLDTVTAALTWCFHFLARNPDHRRQLVADPGLIPSAVEELLRVHSFINPARTVTHDLEFAGVTMQTGDRVLLATALAAQDPNEFPDEAQVRFDRTGNRHLAFGAGPHRCAGSHLARDELTTAIGQWHVRIPDYEIDASEELTLHAGGVFGIDRLPLVWPT
jgi:cytochrome P450